MSSKLLLDVCYLAQVAPSGECLRGKNLVLLIAASLPVLNPAVVLDLCAGTGCAVLGRSLFYAC